MSSEPNLDALPDDPAALKALILEQQHALDHQRRQLDQRERDLRQHHAQLHEQQQTIAELTRENEGLNHRMQMLLRRLYGRRSERMHPNQLLLFGQAMQPEDHPEANEEPKPASQAPVQRRGSRKGHGRQRLPEDLPRHRIEHAVDPEQMSCPCCDQPRQQIGQRITEQLEYAPASLFVLQHIQPKYACRQCEEGGVATANKQHNEVIEQGLPGPGLVAHIATEKYCEHMPLYRQQRKMQRQGVHISRSTMCGWLREVTRLVLPLYRLMGERIRQAKRVHTDDTPLPVQQKGRGKTRTGRLWVYLGDDDRPYIVYDYTPSRSRDGPVQWLAGFTGYLQADAFAGYDGIYATEDVVEVACWAHARRKFYDARLSDPARAHYVLSLIKQMYEVEKQTRSETAEDRLDLRQQKTVPMLDELERWLNEQKDRLLPKSPMATAVNYALNHWQALRRFSEDGDLMIDNNVAERAIRPLAIGRKNYLFVGNDGGGQTAAILYSLITSARRHELDPFAYLRDVFARIGSTSVNELDQFLPDRWSAENTEAPASPA